MPVCGKYIGDKDATCPVLHCVRGVGHPGVCDNVNGDYQVFASTDGGVRFSISHVYMNKGDATRVAEQARKLLPGFRSIEVASSEADRDLHFDYGNETPTCVSPAGAAEIFGRNGW